MQNDASQVILQEKVLRPAGSLTLVGRSHLHSKQINQVSILYDMGN